MEVECKCVLRVQLNNGWDCQYQKETGYCSLLVLQVTQQYMLLCSHRCKISLYQ